MRGGLTGEGEQGLMGAYGGEQGFMGANGCSKNRKLWIRGETFWSGNGLGPSRGVEHSGSDF